MAPRKCWLGLKPSMETSGRASGKRTDENLPYHRRRIICVLGISTTRRHSYLCAGLVVCFKDFSRDSAGATLPIACEAGDGADPTPRRPCIKGLIAGRNGNEGTKEVFVRPGTNGNN